MTLTLGKGESDGCWAMEVEGITLIHVCAKYESCNPKHCIVNYNWKNFNQRGRRRTTNDDAGGMAIALRGQSPGELKSMKEMLMTFLSQFCVCDVNRSD